MPHLFTGRYSFGRLLDVPEMNALLTGFRRRSRFTDEVAEPEYGGRDRKSVGKHKPRMMVSVFKNPKRKKCMLFTTFCSRSFLFDGNQKTCWSPFFCLSPNVACYLRLRTTTLWWTVYKIGGDLFVCYARLSVGRISPFRTFPHPDSSNALSLFTAAFMLATTVSRICFTALIRFLKMYMSIICIHTHTRFRFGTVKLSA